VTPAPPRSTGELWEEIRTFKVPEGRVTIWWLYQAGVVLKTPAGVIALVDAYLSNAVARSYGIERLAPALLDPSEVDADVILATHSHEDHLDPDSIRPFLSHPRTTFVGPPLAVAKVEAAGVEPARTMAVARGDEVRIGDLSIRAVAANHVFAPEPVPDAVGYILEAAGVSVYHSGDTLFDERIERDTRGVTLALVPINGTAGNMDVAGAADLARRQAPAVAVPFHYGLWAPEGYGPGATLDPADFVTAMAGVAPDVAVHILEPGVASTVAETGIAPA
jgi:L-ascorbate 6-phosphate lactonase